MNQTKPRSFTRREFLETTGVGMAGLAVSAPLLAAGADNPNPADLKLLTSTDGVNFPVKESGQMKFSFSWPEPSLEFGGLLFAFELISYENIYAIDPAQVSVTGSGDTRKLLARGFTWAGGQEKIGGYLEANLKRMPNDALEWSLSVKFGKPVKALKTIVRNLPRGRLSKAADHWHDLGDSEKVFEYPDLMNGMATPLMALEAKDGRVWAISALQSEVRPARFFFWPGAEGYKVELISEMAAWDRRGDVRTPTWRIGSAADFDTAVQPHFAHLDQAYRLPAFQSRPDAPHWMKHTGLVLSLHGQHWSGHIFNDYARQLEILRWASTKMDPRNVMVFLAGWDARYYWDYPRFDVDPRMGGEAAFKRIISEGQKLGYRFLLMFGSNVANPAAPGFAKIANAQVRNVYGEFVPGNYVDWDGDRKGDSSMVLMNLAVASWRDHLRGRIAAMIDKYRVDAYFLDICGFWENNPDGDMFVGTQKLVKSLATRYPGIPAVAEMQYDAQMGIIPMSHAPRYPLYPQGNYDHVASFSHLSHPAPGRGSTGVHEAGFRQYRPVTLTQREIPTISFVDDTFDKWRDLVEADIEVARQRLAQRGGLT
jgi:hypothetical protein